MAAAETPESPRRAMSLERRLLRSHLGVAAIGAVLLLVALVATAWLRSTNVRLASLRGPTVRATALASGGLHQSAEALYGWIVTGDAAFSQLRARTWRDQIRPAVRTLERLVDEGDDPELREYLDRLEPVLANLEESQRWIEERVGDGGAPPGTTAFPRDGASTPGEGGASGWEVARDVLVNQVIPATHLATHLLTTLSVKQEELMLADAARVEWFSDVTVVSGVALLLTLVLTAIVASRRHAARLTRPIAELSEATARIAAGRYDGELPRRGDDELARLARSFDTMREALRERSDALERSRSQLRRRNRLLRDEVRERRRAENALARRTRELERANAKLERRNAELDEFTYVASHDLQEPLRKLISFSKLLRVDMGTLELPERAAKDLGFIIGAAERMQRLVQDLLELSRAGRGAMSRLETPLDHCVDAAIEQLEVQIAETGAEIRREGLPVAVVDRTLMTQLFQNLIGNAIKFQPEGQRPVVELTLETTAEGWIAGVRDHGIGLRPEYAERIFTPFKRLHGREEYVGTGIGLAICRKAVERHGGRIWVESRPGDGAHFRFTLGAETRTDGCREAA